MFTDLLIISCILLYGASTAAYCVFLFQQKKEMHDMGVFLLAGAFIVHAMLVGTAFWRAGSIPVHNLHQTLSMAGWIFTGVYLVFHYRYRFRVLGIFTAPAATAVMVISSRLPVEPAHLQEGFSSFWVLFHVVVILMGEAAFGLACAAGILYLVQENALKTKRRGFFYNRLPSLELLDNIGYTCIINGFVLLTAGLIGGFVYARAIWGEFWSGDPKEFWSAVAWFFYAALLHDRLNARSGGRKSAIMAVIGFAVLLCTFVVANFFISGHHQPFTQW
ncbi:MAG: c-type cytochrome biogenesis protein CcsB [Desulfobacterales bacterium]|nr:MAG: c-type cytochrome biogenesis protein CcsB [Desulfobacterales bacterium]